MGSPTTTPIVTTHSQAMVQRLPNAMANHNIIGCEKNGYNWRCVVNIATQTILAKTKQKALQYRKQKHTFTKP